MIHDCGIVMSELAVASISMDGPYGPKTDGNHV